MINVLLETVPAEIRYIAGFSILWLFICWSVQYLSNRSYHKWKKEIDSVSPIHPYYKDLGKKRD